MKEKTTILLITGILLILSAFTVPGMAKGDDEPYFSQVIANPSKTLNFNIYVFHYKYGWVESHEGNYSTISMVIQNDKNAQPLKWQDLKIFIMFKDGTLVHNYTTVAETGNYDCTYTVAPGEQNVQILCFGKKFKPDTIDRIWIKMTHSNFISLIYHESMADGSEVSGGNESEGNNSDGWQSGGGSMEPARALLMKFLEPGSDHAALTSQLRPTQRDYEAYFTNDTWQSAMNKYNELWNSYPLTIAPDSGQTELLLWKADQNEIKNRTGDAAQFPGGYQDIIDSIRPGNTIYYFKFVEPGKTTGLSTDGLTYINNHWVLFPKPWRVIR